MYQANQMFPSYPQAYPQPYSDRLAQLQAQYQQAMPQITQQPVTGGQGVLWVQGDAGAKAYMMAPNTTVFLMDSEAQRFYLKTTDNSGVPTLRTFEYSEVLINASQPLQRDFDDLDSKYVTRAEYEGIQSKFKEIMSKLELMRPQEISESAKAKTKGGIVDE